MPTVAKEKILRGDAVTLINPDHPSPGLVEFIGTLGVDAVFVDCEHGSATTERAEEMVRAAHATGIAALVRPPAAEPWLIARYLDLRADGVVVPHVDTAADAQRIVQTVRYARVHDHAEKIVIVQIESTDAVKNLAEILDVGGVDAFLIGPDDLSRSLGFPGRIDHPDVQAVIDGAIATLCAAGKIPGTLVTVDTVRRYLELGVRLLCGHANAFLTAGIREFLSSATVAIP